MAQVPRMPTRKAEDLRQLGSRSEALPGKSANYNQMNIFVQQNCYWGKNEFKKSTFLGH